MNTQYTPREYAHSVAIDALHTTAHNLENLLDYVPASEKAKIMRQLFKLAENLAGKTNMDLTWTAGGTE